MHLRIIGFNWAARPQRGLEACRIGNIALNDAMILVGRARKRLYLAGIGFTGWRGIPGMREALRGTAASGCEIRVLTMDAKNPAFGHMLNPDVRIKHRVLLKRDPGSKVRSRTLQNRRSGRLRRECSFSKSLFRMTRRLFLRTYFPPIRDIALVLTSNNAVPSLTPFCVNLRSCGKPIRRLKQLALMPFASTASDVAGPARAAAACRPDKT
jgi:hypothetical protein